MEEPLVDCFLEEPSDLTSQRPTRTAPPVSKATRTVGIYSTSLSKLAAKIAKQITEGSDSSSSSESIEWDADGWHYAGANFARRPSANTPTKNDVEAQRVERVLLYILALDAINFCFWPTEDESGASVCRKNLLEYEHLATALRRMAEKDDISGAYEDGEGNKADTYDFSPNNLVNMTTKSLLSEVRAYLPRETEDGGCYHIPIASERVRLLNELGHGLIVHHNGSATSMLEKCIGPNGKPSAVKLVDIITSTFRGFRDESVDAKGRQVCFDKRAQIVTGDIWAAFGRGQKETLGSKLTDFDDMSELTTFADYRVPQLLRHVGVLRYSKELSAKIDNMVELPAGSSDEHFIRAGTVVAVDRLVGEVWCILEDANAANNKIDEVSAVLLDWHLWQIGEKLDREGTLKPHHRVRTIFY